MKSIFTYVVVVLLGFLVYKPTATQAQSFRVFHHPQFAVYKNYNITYDSGSYYFCANWQDLSQPGFAINITPLITQIKGNDTMMRLVPLEFGLGVTAWNGRPYVYKKGFSPSRTGMRVALFPLDSQLRIMSDSIALDSIYTNGWNFKMKSRVAKNQWFYTYSSHDTVFMGNIPALLVYNFQSGAFKHRLFPVTQPIDFPSENQQKANPAVFPHDSGYYVAFDTSFIPTTSFDGLIKASSFLDLDFNLNTRSHHLLEYPFGGPGLNTGLKSVRDYIPLGNQKLFVGIVNRNFNNLNYESYTNDVGIMRYDSNWNIIDTLRIVRPSGVTLSPGLENSACWCNGSLFTVSNIGLDSSSSQNPVWQGIRGLFIAKIDTPLQRRWTRNIFLPSSFLHAELVHCVNGKIEVAGNYTNYGSAQSGYFILEMDTHGNYLPLESSDVVNRVRFHPFPSPFQDFIQLPPSEKPVHSFRMFDLHGKLIYQESQPQGFIATSHLAKGIYVWEVEESDGQLYRGKIVKQ